MPELPEVETIVCSLHSSLVGKKITNAKIFRKNIVKHTETEFQKAVVGKNFQKVFRYGKYIFFDLAGENFLITHLRMTGKFIYPAKEKSNYDRVLFVLDKKEKLLYHDVRCFGTMELFPKNKSFVEKKKLGIDAIQKNLTPQILYQMLKGKKKTIKDFLLDQSQLSGIGNIYASEILFQSKISPFQKCYELKPKEAKKLVLSIDKILSLAIQKNGTSISDYRRVDNKTGEFQNFLKVYGKAGEQCQSCKTTIEKILIPQRKGGRSTYYCPSCQKTSGKNFN